MSTTALNVSNLSLGDLVTSKKGIKSVPLTCANKPAVWIPDAQNVAFEPKSFNNDERMNLVMQASPAAIETLNALDEHIVQQCFADCQRIFGKSLSLDEVRLRYNPCLKLSDKGYAPTFKAKITMTGTGAIKCWNADKTMRKLPTSWVGCVVGPRILLRCIWVMPTAFGCLFECADTLLAEGETEISCPF